MSKLKIVNDNGVTLVEITVTLAVMIILVVSLAFSYQGWIAKYRVESQVKEMYIDLMNGRARAMERNRVHFVEGTAATLGASATYALYEDTNPDPDGNGVLEAGMDTKLLPFPKIVRYPIDWTSIGTTITFSRNGMISLSIGAFSAESVYVDIDACCFTDSCVDNSICRNSDYDCLAITPLKINLGKWNGSDCEAK